MCPGEYQYRVALGRPMPQGWPWEDDLDLVEEEAEAFRALGERQVRIETRLRPVPGSRGDDDVVWNQPPSRGRSG